MRKSLLTLVFAFVATLSGSSQYYVDYGFSVGATSFLGEFGGGEGTRRDFVMDLELAFTRWTVGGFYRYRISQKVAVKADLNYIRLSGDDAKSDNPARRARNLNFKNDMFEFLVNGEYYIYKVNDVGGTGRYSSDFNVYVTGGIGLFYSNPKGETVGGDWVSLKPLATEGNSYSSINFTIPLGIGFYYTIERKYRLGLSFSWRTTFTDYIDDASTVYANDYDGISNKTSPELIDEIGDPDVQIHHFQTGSKRGDPEHNDSYMTATINFSWAKRGRSKFYRAKHSWVLGKKKRRRRKSRAKF